MKQCIKCGEEIKDNAQKCRYCNSYQRFWTAENILNTFSLTLSTLIALGTILFWLITKASSFLHTPSSKLIITPVSIDSKEVKFMAANIGDIDAIITLVKVGGLNIITQLKGNEIIVKPGSTIIYRTPGRGKLPTLLPSTEASMLKEPCELYVQYLDAHSTFRETIIKFACFEEFNKEILAKNSINN